MIEPRSVRKQVLDLIYKAQTSHIGSNFSCIEIMSALYNFADVKSATDIDRDRIILSKGWAAATAYVCLKEKGILTDADLLSYGKPGGLLGLVESSTPGIEASTGSMGHGLPIGLGMAMASKKSAHLWTTYVLLSDGEMGCGTTWESALIAAHHRLQNLVAIVDVNGIQAMGRTSDVLDTEYLEDKWRAFGWTVRIVDGHNMSHLLDALSMTKKHARQPTVIIAKTIKGKGVDFMEDKLEWHYRNVDDESYKKAIAQL